FRRPYWRSSSPEELRQAGACFEAQAWPERAVSFVSLFLKLIRPPAAQTEHPDVHTPRARFDELSGVIRENCHHRTDQSAARAGLQKIRSGLPVPAGCDWQCRFQPRCPVALYNGPARLDKQPAEA